MKRLISFAAIVALLGGLVFLPSGDAEAQSRVKIRPFTYPYVYNLHATAAVNLLVAPGSDLLGFTVSCTGDTTLLLSSVALSVYHASGDSTVWTIYPEDGVEIKYEFPNVRVSSFRVVATNGTVTSPLRFSIIGWY